MKSEQLY